MPRKTSRSSKPRKRRSSSSEARRSVRASRVSVATSKLVRLKLTGGFEYAAAIVERVSFPLDASWKGQRPVEVLPPTLDAEVHIWSRVPTKFEVTVTLNGVEAKAPGVTKYPGRHIQLFAFPLSAFTAGTIAILEDGRR